MTAARVDGTSDFDDGVAPLATLARDDPRVAGTDVAWGKSMRADGTTQDTHRSATIDPHVKVTISRPTREPDIGRNRGLPGQRASPQQGRSTKC